MDKYPDDLKDRFDLVVLSGALYEGHIPYNGLDDVHASLKKNAFFATALRSSYMVKGEKEGYMDKIDDMIEEGKFKILHTGTHMRGIEGTENVYKK